MNTPRSFWVIAALGLLAGCTGGSPPDWYCDDNPNHSDCVNDGSGGVDGETDDPTVNPNIDTTNVTFVAEFGGVPEACLLRVECEGMNTYEQLTTAGKFLVLEDGCTVTMGGGPPTVWANPKPTHRSADGRLWTGTYDVDLTSEAYDPQTGEYVLPGDWYLDGNIECSYGNSTYVTPDFFIDENGKFELEGVATGANWFQVMGDTFVYGGTIDDFDVTDVVITSTSFDFTWGRRIACDVISR